MKGAGDGIRTRDTRLGKPLRYHCATPALFYSQYYSGAFRYVKLRQGTVGASKERLIRVTLALLKGSFFHQKGLPELAGGSGRVGGRSLYLVTRFRGATRHGLLFRLPFATVPPR